MKKNISKILFLIIYCLLFIPNFASAGYRIEIALPNVVSGRETTFPEYIGYLYTFGISAVILLSLGGLVIGGFMYMLSDVVNTKEKAKGYIWGALSGLVLILAAYLILNTINPNLVNLKGPNLPKLEAIEETNPNLHKTTKEILEEKAEASWVGKCECKVGEDPDNPNIYTLLKKSTYGESKSECENNPICDGCTITVPCAQK